ncbi:hypothetical protein B0H14DRAFT_2643152 [Mycena olivaceomarginata]|nr:hypothetical protein B0H14DRAFT_2643152 [Mycena olivaceomarginata]
MTADDLHVNCSSAADSFRPAETGSFGTSFGAPRNAGFGTAEAFSSSCARITVASIVSRDTFHTTEATAETGAFNTAENVPKSPTRTPILNREASQTGKNNGCHVWALLKPGLKGLVLYQRIPFSYCGVSKPPSQGSHLATTITYAFDRRPKILLGTWASTCVVVLATFIPLHLSTIPMERAPVKDRGKSVTNQPSTSAVQPKTSTAGRIRATMKGAGGQLLQKTREALLSESDIAWESSSAEDVRRHLYMKGYSHDDAASFDTLDGIALVLLRISAEAMSVVTPSEKSHSSDTMWNDYDDGYIFPREGGGLDSEWQLCKSAAASKESRPRSDSDEIAARPALETQHPALAPQPPEHPLIFPVADTTLDLQEIEELDLVSDDENFNFAPVQIPGDPASDSESDGPAPDSGADRQL